MFYLLIYIVFSPITRTSVRCRGHLTINDIYQTIKISVFIWRPFNYYFHISDNTEINSGVTLHKPSVI